MPPGPMRSNRHPSVPWSGPSPSGTRVGHGTGKPTSSAVARHFPRSSGDACTRREADGSGGSRSTGPRRCRNMRPTSATSATSATARTAPHFLVLTSVVVSEVRPARRRPSAILSAISFFVSLDRLRSPKRLRCRRDCRRSRHRLAELESADRLLVQQVFKPIANEYRDSLPSPGSGEEGRPLLYVKQKKMSGRRSDRAPRKGLHPLTASQPLARA